MENKQYHHGDLKVELIQKGLNILDRSGEIPEEYDAIALVDKIIWKYAFSIIICFRIFIFIIVTSALPVEYSKANT